MLIIRENQPQKWLTLKDAAQELAAISGKKISTFRLMSCCLEGDYGVYLDCTRAQGESLWNEQECLTYGSGICRIKLPKFTEPSHWMKTTRLHRCVIGPAVQHPIGKDGRPLPGVLQDERAKDRDCLEWFVDADTIEYKPLFKPEDICSLAANMKGQARISAAYAELDSLRSELEQERTLRQAVESELIELRNSLAEMKSKPLDPRERSTFERLVYVLAVQAKFDPKSEKAVKHAAELLGIQGLTGKGTVAKYLEAAFKRGENERQAE